MPCVGLAEDEERKGAGNFSGQAWRCYTSFPPHSVGCMGTYLQERLSNVA